MTSAPPCGGLARSIAERLAGCEGARIRMDPDLNVILAGTGWRTGRKKRGDSWGTRRRASDGGESQSANRNDVG